MRKVITLLMVLMVNLCAVAEMSLPGWIGSDRTVHAEWSSWTENGDVYAADAWSASDASLLTEGAPDAAVYEGVSRVVSYNGAKGVLLLDAQGFSNMDFFMPNYQGGTKKEICVQITYQLNSTPLIGVKPYIDDQLQVNGIFGPYSQGKDVIGACWVTEAFLFVIEPNPDSEYITLGFARGDCQTIAVDNVTIDTVCVPEPATMGLLLLGSMFCAKKRK